MFFTDRIKNIIPTDKVLEIGPGAHPYHRSDVLLELEYKDEKERSAQFGHDAKLVSDKKVIFYDGKKLPFKDKEFDYVICSHVLEHIEDVPAFLEEIFRVANKGYFEYPLVYYDYLYNYDVHVNFLKYDNSCLKYIKKKNTGLNEFKPVQEFFSLSFAKGHATLVNELLPFFMEGFEWDKPFKVQEAKKLEEICHQNLIVPDAKIEASPTTWQLFRRLVGSIIKK